MEKVERMLKLQSYASVEADVIFYDVERSYGK